LFSDVSLDEGLSFALHRVLALLSYSCWVDDNLVVNGQMFDDFSVCFGGSRVASDLGYRVPVGVVEDDDSLEGIEVAGGCLVLHHESVSVAREAVFEEVEAGVSSD
jgi:hypothetical protein